MEALLTATLFLAEFVVRLVLAGYIVLRSRGTPATRLAWLVLILAVPVVGVVAYLLVGEARLGRRRIARYQDICRRIGLRDAAYLSRSPPVPSAIAEREQPIAVLAESVGGNLPQGGHDLRLYGDTDLFIQALVEDIEHARRHCHLLFYIFLTDHSSTRVAEALMRAAGRGVTCRLLLDAVGSKLFLRSRLRRRLEASGVQVTAALPASIVRALLARLDLRNHRKIAIIDGRVGYCGSQNIADAEFAIKARYAPWVDAMVRLRGPAVRDLQVLFVQDWYLDTNEALKEVLAIRPDEFADGATVQVVGTGPTAFNEALVQVGQASFSTAREELILTTPYFVPDEATLAGLYATARRGVEVTLVVPARNDSPLVGAASHSYYERLLDAGVGIHEYRRGLLHAKTISVDRRFAVVTTANLDRRSFDLNFEVTLLVYDSDFASQLRLLQRSYLDDSIQVSADAWSRRGWPRRLWENSLGMMSPLL